MCPPVRLSAPACLCDISPTGGLPSHWGGGRGRLSFLDVFTLFAGWAGCCLALNLVQQLGSVIRLGRAQRKGCPQPGDSPHDPHLPSMPASPPAGALVTLPLAATPQQAVRCSPPQFPSPRKVAVANSSRHLCSMIYRSSRCSPISKNRSQPRFPCLRPATCNRGTANARIAIIPTVTTCEVDTESTTTML